MPITLRHALYDRLNSQGCFESIEQNYRKFEEETLSDIKEIEYRLTLLDEQLYEIIELFSKNIRTDIKTVSSDSLIQEKENRQWFKKLNMKRSELFDELKKAESLFLQKSAINQKFIDRYNELNVDELDDDTVLGTVKDLAVYGGFTDLTSEIEKDSELKPNRGFFKSLSMFLKEIFSFSGTSN